MEEKSNGKALSIIIAAVVIVGLIISYMSSQGGEDIAVPVTAVSNIPNQSPAPAKPIAKPPAISGVSRQEDLSLEQKCSTDGSQFFNDWLSTTLPKGWSYEGPEYHYSQSMNTCLMYVGEVSPINSFQVSSISDSLQYQSTANRVDYVYNIYENVPVLESSYIRTCTTGQDCFDVPSSIFDSPTKSVNSTDFLKEKMELMNN